MAITTIIVEDLEDGQVSVTIEMNPPLNIADEKIPQSYAYAITILQQMTGSAISGTVAGIAKCEKCGNNYQSSLDHPPRHVATDILSEEDAKKMDADHSPESTLILESPGKVVLDAETLAVVDGHDRFQYARETGGIVSCCFKRAENDQS